MAALPGIGLGKYLTDLKTKNEASAAKMDEHTTGLALATTEGNLCIPIWMAGNLDFSLFTFTSAFWRAIYTNHQEGRRGWRAVDPCREACPARNPPAPSSGTR